MVYCYGVFRKQERPPPVIYELATYRVREYQEKGRSATKWLNESKKR